MPVSLTVSVLVVAPALAFSVSPPSRSTYVLLLEPPTRSSTCTVAVSSVSAYTSINAAMPPVLMLDDEVVSLEQPRTPMPSRHARPNACRIMIRLQKEREKPQAYTALPHSDNALDATGRGRAAF